MTDKQPIYRNPWMWIQAAIIIVALLLIWRGCTIARNGVASNALLKSQLDSTTTAMNNMSGRFIADRQIQDARLQASNQETQAALHERDSSDRLVQSTQATAGRLATQLRYAREALPEDSLLTVSQRYILNCDSLGDIVPVLNAQIDGLREDNDKLGELMQYEVELRQTAIKAEQHRTDSAMGLMSLFRKIALRAVKDATPHRKLYITGSAQYTPLGTTWGGGFTLANKKGTMYTAQAVYGHGWGIGVQVSQLLSLRRKK